MNIEEVKQKITPILDRYGIKRAAVFGSVARGEARSSSDVDLLVNMKKTDDLLDFVRLKFALEKKLRRRVDLVTYGNLSPFIKRRVDKEQIKIL